MRDSHKELAIKTAIQEYKNSVLFGFSSNTAHAINMMENVFIMCSGNIEGIEELQMHGCHREYPETSGKVRGDREHRISGRHRKLCHDRIHVSKYSGGTL